MTTEVLTRPGSGTGGPQTWVDSTGIPVSGGASPLTTKGDVFGYSTTNARIPVGTNGQVLTADSTQTLGVKWAAGGSGTVTAVTGTAPIVSSGGTTPAISLANTAVTPGSYTSTNLTVDAQGRITAASNGSGASVYKISGVAPTAAVGVAYTWTPTQTGGSSSFWSVPIGGASLTTDGLSFSTSTGTVSGTPSNNQPIDFHMSATLSTGETAWTHQQITVTGTVTFYWSGTDHGTAITISNGMATNDVMTNNTGGTWNSGRSITHHTSGKWWAAMRIGPTTFAATHYFFGLADNAVAMNSYLGGAGGNVMGWQIANAYYNAGVFSAATGYSNLLIGSGGPPVDYYAVMAVDITAGQGWLSVGNGSGLWGGWMNGGNPDTGTSPTFTFTPGTDLYLAGSIFSGTDGQTNLINTGPLTVYGITTPTTFSPWG